jgi:hypothetical protein
MTSLRENTSLGFLKFISIYPGCALQKQVENRKNVSPKNMAERSHPISHFMIPVRKLKEVFVLGSMLKKNLSRILKIHPCFPKNFFFVSEIHGTIVVPLYKYLS